MRSLYNIIIHISGFIVQILALFNSKLKQGVVGRKETFPRLKKAISSSNKTIWMHCASLGEYEQGLPLLQELKLEYPDHKIVLSFFSPSGYENKKNTIYADVVVYLPLDTKANAKQFLDATRPDLILFVKYESSVCFPSRTPKEEIQLPCFGKPEPKGKLRCGKYTPELLTENTDDKSTDGK